MRRTTRITIAVLVTGGLAVGTAGPSLANTSDVNLRQDDMRGCSWSTTTTTVTRKGGNSPGPITPSQSTNDATRSVLTGPGQTDVTRDWTRSVRLHAGLNTKRTPEHDAKH